MEQKNDIQACDSFIESPIFDNWFKSHYPKHSLLICSPYIKKDALDKVIALYKLNERDKNFDFRIAIRGNSNEFTFQKSSDIAAFDSLICLNQFDIENVKRITNLHMKAYLIDGTELLITSGNLTNSGLFVITGKENFEGGISTRNPKTIADFKKYFEFIWSQGEVLNDFYDELMHAYSSYIKTEYSDNFTWQQINKKSYSFKRKSSFDSNILKLKDASNLKSDKATNNKDIEITTQKFSLGDIPPVGTLSHVPAVLQFLSEHPCGVTYLDLGKALRKIFGDGESDTEMANRKFGEEKGKFCAFLGFAIIENSQQGKVVKLSNLGKLYLSMNDEEKNKLIKDIFFDKTIVVSIMRQVIHNPKMNILDYLQKNCEGATKSTLARKVRPLKNLFAHIGEICTKEELKKALTQL